MTVIICRLLVWFGVSGAMAKGLWADSMTVYHLVGKISSHACLMSTCQRNEVLLDVLNVEKVSYRT